MIYERYTKKYSCSKCGYIITKTCVSPMHEIKVFWCKHCNCPMQFEELKREQVQFT